MGHTVDFFNVSKQVNEKKQNKTKNNETFQNIIYHDCQSLVFG